MSPSLIWRGLHRSVPCRFLVLTLFCFAAAAQAARAQEYFPDPLVRVSFPNPFADAAASSLAGGANASQAASPTGEPAHPVTWKTAPLDILKDQKHVWLFPVQLAHGRHLIPTLAVIGITAGLIVADAHDMPYFARTTDFNRFNETFNGSFTGAVIGAVPASFYVYGLVRHDSYAADTAILAGEAYADSAIPQVVIKVISRRYRPSAIPPNSNFSDTFFKSSTSVFGKGSSFPSGHAAGAFSVATVIARRYKEHRWVPWAAYGIAGLFAFSRIPDRAHFPSDVFLGAALGYTITRYVVFRDGR
jgi:membrane-associated phospholipid phosphatase